MNRYLESTPKPGQINSYLEGLYPQSFKVAEEVSVRTQTAGLPLIHVPPIVAIFLQFLVSSRGAKRCLEIGTLAGYSTLHLAWGVGSSGRVVSVDKDPRVNKVALESVEKYRVADRVDLVAADALQWLKDTTNETANLSGEFDLIFVDAEKSQYGELFNLAVNRLSTTGLLVFDNTLEFSNHSVSNPADLSTATKAMRQFNKMVASKSGVESVLLPIGSGLTLISKIPSQR